ncbi:hypothetical protein KIW84_020962, partial [Lathyrus oleraceus]
NILFDIHYIIFLLYKIFYLMNLFSFLTFIFSHEHYKYLSIVSNTFHKKLLIRSSKKMKTKLFSFLYSCALLFFFVGAIEASKYRKQFGEIKETKASTGLDGYAIYRGGLGVWNSGGSAILFPNIRKGANDNGNIISFPKGGKNGGGRNKILGRKQFLGKASMEN